jgi:hypothetical protein
LWLYNPISIGSKVLGGDGSFFTLEPEQLTKNPEGEFNSPDQSKMTDQL